MMDSTIEIPLNNPVLLERFEELREEFYRLREEYGVEDGVSEKFAKDYDHEWYCDLEYLDWVEEQHEQGQHTGFPETYCSINIPELARKRPHEWGAYRDRAKNQTAQLLGCNASALTLFYPKDGFVGWHTNHNLPSHQILFTWSETGDGFFRYMHPKTKEIVTLQDKPGWNVRAHYFGDTEDTIYWHCAHTNCDRFSFAYKFEVRPGYNEETVVRMFEEALDDITGE